MRGKSSSSKSRANGGLLESDKLEKLKEPHLSGAYIRSLVKQLTSSRTKDSSTLEGDGISSTNHNLPENGSVFDDQKQEQKSQSPQPHKKQVRRRLHTSRPYQERLLNMAEARREIVTALKFHRASMKEASEKQQQQLEIQPLESSYQLSLEQEAKLKSRRNPRIYASNSSTYTNNLDSFSYSPGLCSPYSCPVSSIGPPPPPPPTSFFQENLNFSLPSQALGLNLNLQDFTNLDTSSLYCGSNPSSIYSSSSPSTTSSSTPSVATEEIPSMVVPTVEFGGMGLHQAMDDKEMEEMRSIGEQHEVEWNDRMNMMGSACWFKFLKAMEIDQKAEDFVSSPFDEVLEFPPWLNPNESCLQDVDEYCFDGYSQDPALPCMDIEEIEGMDGGWLA